MISLTTKLKEDLYTTLSNTTLAIDVIYFVFKDVFREIENGYYQFLNMQENDDTKIDIKTDDNKHIDVKISGKDFNKVVENINNTIVDKNKVKIKKDEAE